MPDTKTVKASASAEAGAGSEGGGGSCFASDRRRFVPDDEDILKIGEELAFGNILKRMFSPSV